MDDCFQLADAAAWLLLIPGARWLTFGFLRLLERRYSVLQAA